MLSIAGMRQSVREKAFVIDGDSHPSPAQPSPASTRGCLHPAEVGIAANISYRPAAYISAAQSPFRMLLFIKPQQPNLLMNELLKVSEKERHS